MRNILTLSYVNNTNYTFKGINIDYSKVYRGVMINKYSSINYRMESIKGVL